MKNTGSLPSQFIKQLIDAGLVVDTKPENIRPSSLDLSLFGEGYRVQGSFLPSCSETVHRAIKRLGGIKLKGDRFLLERGACYVFRLNERINHLPEGSYGYANPKSSSGRIDLHVRMLADKVSRYDVIPQNYCGPLWLLVTPNTFPVIISPDLTLNQVRFFNQDTRLDELGLEMNFEANGGLLFSSGGEMIRYKDVKHSDKDGSILLSLGLNLGISGFEAVETGEPIDLSLKRHYDPKNFFRQVSTFDNNKFIVLKVGTFYILSIKEFVRVPPNFACEMRPMDSRSGLVRSHFAGFIDPGWGVGPNNEAKGRPLTLEVRSFDSNLVICDGQPIAKVRFERMIEEPEMHYDQMGPTYGVQSGPELGKYFIKN